MDGHGEGNADEERGVRGEKIHVDSGRKKKKKKKAPRSVEEEKMAREAGNTDELGKGIVPSRWYPGDPPSGQRRAQCPVVYRL